MYRLIKRVFLFLLFSIPVCFPQKVFANGAAWMIGTQSAPPHPIKQNDLILDKEKVLFSDRKVTASFWVINPTTNDVQVTMGFPLEYNEYKEGILKYHAADDEEFNKALQEYMNDLLGNFHVLINGKKIPARLTKDFENDYPIVINWEMDVPKRSTIVFTVIYPMSYFEADSENYSSQEFEYITHTGGYWSKPIREAEFKYCGGNISNLKVDSSGKIKALAEEWTNEGWSVKKERTGISPRPYHYDPVSKCIVFERKNWTPTKNDDIKITTNVESHSYEGEFVKKDFNETVMKHWCGQTEDEEKGHFSKSVNLSSRIMENVKSGKLTSESHNYISELTNDSYTHVTGTEREYPCDICDPFYELPSHLLSDYQLLLLRYLRNSFFAKYGYKFKDQQLAKCFQNVKPIKGKVTEREKSNIEFIKAMEEDIKETNRKAWAHVRKHLKE